MGESFFSKLFAAIFGSDDPEAQKKRALKNISKSLKKTGYKFIEFGDDQVLPAYGKFFWDLYKIVASAQLTFQQQMNPAVYKNLVIDYSLSEEQKTAIEELEEENILQLSNNMPFEQLKEKIKQNIELISSDFDMEKINRIDDLYNKLMQFRSFCLYDYYFMLKKFDSRITEGDFSKTPKFEPIDATYIAEDLKDFVSVLYSMPLETSWSDVWDLFQKMRGAEPIKAGVWAKVCNKLNLMKAQNVFDMMLQLITKNPDYHSDFEAKRENIVESYLDKIRNQANAVVRKIEVEQKNNKVGGLLQQIFGTTDVVALKAYTENGSSIFERKNLGSYMYAKPLNYLKSFLVEFVKKNVREYNDLVIIRGKWTNQALSTQMSEDYNSLLESSDSIAQYDEKLCEDQEFGSKIKTWLPQTDRNKDAANIIRTILKDANDFAKEELIKCTRSLISYAKSVKSLIEDHQKSHPELLMNWKELERFSEQPIQTVGVDIYKKIYLIASLMQNFLQ